MTAYSTFVALAIAVAISVATTVLKMILFPPTRPTPFTNIFATPRPEDGKHNLRQNVPSLCVVLGRVKKGGDYAFLAETGGSAFHVIVTASHRINAFVQHYLHDEPVELTDMIVTEPTHYDEKVSIDTRLGVDAETPYAILIEKFPLVWTENHRGDGLASIMMEVKTVAQESFIRVYPQQMPIHTAVVEGGLLYDPREPSHDPDDPGTWAFTRNLALMRLFHLTHPSGGKLSFDDMYLPDWEFAADVCDDIVTNKAEEEEPRYHGGIWYRYENDPVEVGRQIDQAAELVLYERPDGLIGVHAGVFVEPDIRITADDIRQLHYDANRRAATTVLAVRGRFTEPLSAYNTADAAIWGDPYISGDDTQRTKTVDNPAVQSHNHMQRLQKIAMIRANAPRVSLVISYDPFSDSRNVVYRRFVTVHYPDRGLDEAVIEIIGRPKRGLVNPTIEIDGIVVSPTLYDFDAYTEEGDYTPAIPDPFAGGVPVPTGFVVSIARAVIAGSSPAAFAIGEWDFLSDALTYELEWLPADLLEAPQSANSKPGETEVRSNYLTDDVTYSFRLRAWSNGDPSEWTSYVNATISTNFPNQAATFDGTNDYMHRTADLTGIADGKAGTISAWVKFNGGDAASQVIMTTNNAIGTGRMNFFRNTSNTMGLRLRNAAGTVLVSFNGSSTLVAGATWHHVMASWDLAAGVAQMYVDDVQNVTAPSVTNDTIDYTTGDVFVGADNAAAAKLNANLADLWFHPTHIDLSVTANRRKFIDAAGKPRYLGANGQTPLGLTPLVFIAIDPAAATVDGFTTNRGSGGGFTLVGALGLATGPG